MRLRHGPDIRPDERLDENVIINGALRQLRGDPKSSRTDVIEPHRIIRSGVISLIGDRLGVDLAVDGYDQRNAEPLFDSPGRYRQKLSTGTWLRNSRRRSPRAEGWDQQDLIPVTEFGTGPQILGVKADLPVTRSRNSSPTPRPIRASSATRA
jgi:hypothetical protein